MPDVTSGECTAAEIMTKMCPSLVEELTAAAVATLPQMTLKLSMLSRTKWGTRRTSR